MQSRQRYTLTRQMGPNRMGPGPYSGYGPMMGPYGGGGPMMGGQHPFQGGSPMMGQMMGRPQGRRNGGGLLAKLLGGNKQKAGQFVGGFQGSSRSVSKSGGGIGGILQTLSSPDKVSGFLNNTQQVLKTAQSIGPMIQQYGPIVKNLPAMWRLYKGLKDAPSEEEGTIDNEADSPVVEDQSPQEEKKNRKKTRKTNQNETIKENKQSHRTSVPKLYI
nr:YqfQ family protein [Neobacillus sp. Marseille-Q6967]